MHQASINRARSGLLCKIPGSAPSYFSASLRKSLKSNVFVPASSALHNREEACSERPRLFFPGSAAIDELALPTPIAILFASGLLDPNPNMRHLPSWLL